MGTCYIFGAGASLPFVPGQAALVDGLWSANLRQTIAAKQYLNRFFKGVDRSTLTFEQVIGPLEIAEAEDHWFHLAGRRKSRLVTNRAVLKSFDHWIVRSLDPETLPRFPKDQSDIQQLESYKDTYSSFGKHSIPYAKMLGNLRNSGTLHEATFITLNYDLLLDRTLMADGFRLDYCIDAFADDERMSGDVKLLKLHGSLNWSICDECHVMRRLGSKAAWPDNDCGDCGGVRSRNPVLIRPTVAKDFRLRLWHQMWRSAGHALRDSDKWVIIGYSLPFADVWILRLLMQSMVSGKGNSRAVTIVNPEAAALARFGGLFPEAQLVKGTFEHWLESVEG